MTISSWNPDLTTPPGTSKASLNGYLCVPWAGGAPSSPVTPSGQIQVIAANQAGTSSQQTYAGTWQSLSTPSGLAQACWTGSGWCGVTASNVVYTSTDGITWTMGTTLTGGTMNYLGNNGLTIAVVLDSNVVRISQDGGATWDTNHYTPFGGSGVNLVHATVVGSRVFVTGNLTGSSLSAYAYADIGSIPAPGSAWSNNTLGGGTSNGSNVLSSGGALYAAGGVSSGQVPLYRSLDNGATFTALTTNLPSDGSAIYYLYFSNVLNALVCGRVLSPYLMTSADGGNTWNALSTGLSVVPDCIIDSTSSAPQLLCTQRSSGVYGLTGTTWSQVAATSCYALGNR